MTKMDALPIYGKKFSKTNFLLRNQWNDFHKGWYEASRTLAHQTFGLHDHDGCQVHIHEWYIKSPLKNLLLKVI